MIYLSGTNYLHQASTKKRYMIAPTSASQAVNWEIKADDKRQTRLKVVVRQGEKERLRELDALPPACRHCLGSTTASAWQGLFCSRGLSSECRPAGVEVSGRAWGWELWGPRAGCGGGGPIGGIHPSYGEGQGAGDHLVNGWGNHSGQRVQSTHQKPPPTPRALPKMLHGSGWAEMLAGVQEGEGKHAAPCLATQQYSNSYLTSDLPHLPCLTLYDSDIEYCEQGHPKIYSNTSHIFLISSNRSSSHHILLLYMIPTNFLNFHSVCWLFLWFFQWHLGDILSWGYLWEILGTSLGHLLFLLFFLFLLFLLLLIFLLLPLFLLFCLCLLFIFSSSLSSHSSLGFLFLERTSRVFPANILYF